jgi:drug/metabolite transporter (DMT)-like permease
MAVVLALVSAVAVGSADFFGGLAARRDHVLRVIAWSQAIGVPLALLLAFLLPGEASARALAWGGASGVVNLVGVGALYRGFQVGRVSVVAPLSAVVAAAVPILVGFGVGDRPGLPAWLGFVVGLAAIALISIGSNAAAGTASQLGVIHGIVAGMGFAGLFVLLDLAGDTAGIWPLVTGRFTAALLAGGAALLGGTGLALHPDARPPALGAGVLAAVGNGAFLVAVQTGLLSVVAVVTSLYPAATVLWARLVLDEHIARHQGLGLAMALVAIALIVSG